MKSHLKMKKKTRENFGENQEKGCTKYSKKNTIHFIEGGDVKLYTIDSTWRAL